MLLKSARLNRGMSINEVAQHVGIKPNTYSYYERTGGMPRDPKVAKRIADLLDSRVSDLWDINGNAEAVA